MKHTKVALLWFAVFTVVFTVTFVYAQLMPSSDTVLRWVGIGIGAAINVTMTHLLVHWWRTRKVKP